MFRFPRPSIYSLKVYLLGKGNGGHSEYPQEDANQQISRLAEMHPGIYRRESRKALEPRLKIRDPHDVSCRKAEIFLRDRAVFDFKCHYLHTAYENPGR